MLPNTTPLVTIAAAPKPAEAPRRSPLPKTRGQAQALLSFYHARARQLSREKRAAEAAWRRAEDDLILVQATAEGEYPERAA